MSAPLTLSRALAQSDEVVIDGWTFELKYDEMQLSHDGSGYRFKSGDQLVVLPMQDLQVEVNDGVEGFRVKDTDGEDLDIEFFQVERVALALNDMQETPA